MNVVYLGEILDEWERKDPENPFVAVFKPVFQDDESKLEKEAASHYCSIRNSPLLSEKQRESLSNVFIHWMMERLKEKTYEELIMILELPDIEETRCGQQLIERGVERGIERGLETGIEKSIILQARKKFGAVIDAAVEKRVSDLDQAGAEILLVEMLDIDSFERFESRLSEILSSK